MNSIRHLTSALLAVVVLLILPGASAINSTINSTSKFAYSANAGWINFRHDQPSSPNGIVFGEYFLSGLAYGANFGWVDFGDGSPANGIQYQNNSATDCGVNHDGQGNLSGLAYGANVGWINFGWAAPEDANRPRVHLLAGGFSGFAYSANMGWIPLGERSLITDTMAITDTDADGIADAWELIRFANLTAATATSDADADGASDKDEYLAATDPENGADSLRFLSQTSDTGPTQTTVIFNTNAIRLYRLETSASPGPAPDVWTTSAHGTFAPDAGTSTTKTITWPGTTRQFLRAAAVRPLP